MEQNNFNELNNINPSEYNKSPDELNVIEITNENQYYDNRLVEKKSNKNKNKKINTFKLIASFVVVCAVAAIVQTTFPIPIFSRIFSPPTSPVAPTPTYTFSSVIATDKSIDFSLTLENIELENNAHYLYIVNQNNATDEYIESIPYNIKSGEQIKITNIISTYNFTTYTTKSGSIKIQPATDYTIVVVNNEKIVQKYNITTVSKNYLSEINAYFENGYINITLKADESFQNFGVILIQVTNLTNPTWGGQGNGVDQTTCDEYNLPNSTFAFPVVKTTETQNFEVKIYSKVMTQEQMELPDTIAYGDDLNPEYYYLIYTYQNPLKY